MADENGFVHPGAHAGEADARARCEMAGHGGAS
jgi:hypothetical protein